MAIGTSTALIISKVRRKVDDEAAADYSDVYIADRAVDACDILDIELGWSYIMQSIDPYLISPVLDSTVVTDRAKLSIIAIQTAIEIKRKELADTIRKSVSVKSGRDAVDSGSAAEGTIKNLSNEIEELSKLKNTYIANLQTGYVINTHDDTATV